MASRNPTTRCGIYAIRCLANGKVYVGSSAGIDARWTGHRYDLKNGRHHSPSLQNAWTKYGAAAFSFEVLELVPADQLIAAEQRHIDAMKACDRRHGFNVCPAAGSPAGVKNPAVSAANRARECTPETRAKHAENSRRLLAQDAELREKLREGLSRPETRAKLSEAGKRQVQTAETRAKRAASLKGRTFSPETIEKMRLAAALRGPVSEETRAKMPETKKRQVQTEETKAKRAATLKGRRPSEAAILGMKLAWENRSRVMSDEQKQKISTTMTGRKPSPEHLAKVTAVNRAKAADPKFRAKLVAAAQAKELNTEYRAKRAALLSQRRDDPEWLAKMAAINQAKAQDPEFRARHREAMQARRGKPHSDLAKERMANARRKHSLAQVREIQEMLAGGSSLADVARRFDCSPATIRRAKLVKLPEPSPSPGGNLP